MYRTIAVLTLGVTLIAACSDNGTGPPLPPYTIEIVAEGDYSLVALNDAAQALLTGPDGPALWTLGQGLERVPLVSVDDLGPDGSVLGTSANGLVSLWQGRTLTEIAEGIPVGIANQTRQAYFRQDNLVRAWDGASADSAGYGRVHLVGEDGALYGHTWHEPTVPWDSYGTHECWRQIAGETEVYEEASRECRAVAANAEGWVLFTVIYGNSYDRPGLWDGQGYVPSVWNEMRATDLNDLGVVVGAAPFSLWSNGDVTHLDSFMADHGWTENTDARINNSGQLLFDVGEAVILLTPSS